ncbi:nuclear transport factor 2 family protein [Thalassolituus sp.]|uniref:nuclear transport factor 2 family protein n=1 Tax=Thalassolituus sp. TaxID=2030822 RepID=UPI00351103E7
MNTTAPLSPAERFIALYEQLQPGPVTRAQLESVYAPHIVFSDPLHSVRGLDQLTQYFDGLYRNISDIEFEFHRTLNKDSETIAHWTMHFRHPRILRGKKRISVEGTSILRWQDDLIIAHQDIFDAGALLYEHLPVLGWVIRKLKERMQ